VLLFPGKGCLGPLVEGRGGKVEIVKIIGEHNYQAIESG